jgi:hypothetical protein
MVSKSAHAKNERGIEAIEVKKCVTEHSLDLDRAGSACRLSVSSYLTGIISVRYGKP